MRTDLTRPAAVRVWRIFAAGCVAAFLLAIALSAAPRLHDEMHRVQGAEHACAVTLISSGGCDCFTAAAPSGLPAEAAPTPIIRGVESIAVVAVFAPSILEHAPPRLA